MVSFIQNGHTYHLYTYEPIDNVPDGVVVKDGNEILDKSEIFYYSNGSPSAFSNLFRYTLLYKKGGYWVDTDIVCHKPFHFTKEYLFITEPDSQYNKSILTPSVIKAPMGSEHLSNIIKRCYLYKKAITENKMKWGMGPATIKELVIENKLFEYIVPWNTFMTCFCFHYISLLNPTFKPHPLVISKPTEIPNNMIGVHFWNECFRRNNLDKNGTYQENSLFEFFKKKYNV